MTKSKEIEAIDHLTIMADECDKIVSLTNNLEDLSKDETQNTRFDGLVLSSGRGFTGEEIETIYKKRWKS